MNALLLPADAYGCGYYRMQLPGHYTEADVSWADRLGRDKGRVLVEDGTDVVVLQRPMDARIVEYIHQLQRQDVAVVVELDDDLAALDAQHVSFRQMHPGYTAHNWAHLKDACACADLVTCTTPALAARYAGHGRVAVLPNYVESSLLRHEPEARKGYGWAGYVPTHPHDLAVVGTAVRDLMREGHTFRVVGPPLGVRGALALDDEPQATGWLGLGAYFEAVAQLQVGMVPLADSAFNRAKSWLKGLEYAALGVAFVASPTPEYVRLQDKAGAGLLADKPKRWRTYLRHLVVNDAARIELADHQRDSVRAALTIETNAWRWDEAWDQARRNRRVRAANPAHAAA